MKPIEMKIDALIASPNNVRRTGGLDIDSLKASIKAHGLLQNLVIQEVDGKAQVVAGNRRLAALKQLQSEGALPADFKVPCFMVVAENSQEVALAENVQRVAMHPADEFEAFAALAHAGYSYAEIAERFGCHVCKIKQRMLLAAVVPELIALYRQGEMTLEVLEAFTVSDDHAAQLAAWENCSNFWKDDADHIRGLLSEGKYASDEALVKFVGIDHYIKAGGQIREDLFGEVVYVENESLLNRLASEKMEHLPTELQADGWAWVELDLGEIDYRRRDKYAHLGCYFQSKNSEIFKEGERKFAGCLVGIDRDGELEIEYGYVKKENSKALEAYRRGASILDSHSADLGDENTEKSHVGKDMPASLRDYLEGQRLEVMQIAVGQHSRVAFDLLLYSLVAQVIDRAGFDIPLGANFNIQHSNIVAELGPWQDHITLEKLLPKGWQTENRQRNIENLSHLALEKRMHLLAYCVAHLIPAQMSGRDNAIEWALTQTGIDVASYWRPSAENYLNKLRKEQLLDLGEQLAPVGWRSQWEKSKKSEIVATLDKMFAEPESVTRDAAQIAAINAWLPEGMASLPKPIAAFESEAA